MNSDVIALNDAIFASTLKKVQAFFEYLRREYGTAVCLRAIKALAVDTGFIKDDLGEVVRYVVHTATPGLTFRVQYNPARGTRFGGAGRKDAPPGRELVHNGCPLAPDNFPVQQCGTELPFACRLAGTLYNLVAQPFPFQKLHLIAAVHEFRPQDVAAHMVDQILREMVDLATWCPENVVMLNGSKGAGASIDWFHLQQFSRPEGEPFPLEALAANQITYGQLRLIGGYPLPIVVTRGAIVKVIPKMAGLIANWIDHYGPSATMNLMATTASCDDGDVVVYFCPRDRRNARVPGFSGAVGGLEILGELLAHSDAEKQRIENGEINARYVYNVLSAVRAEGFERFFVHYVRSH